jgi:hypothetical protein
LKSPKPKKVLKSSAGGWETTSSSSNRKKCPEGGRPDPH